MHASGKIVVVTVRGAFSSDITIGASDSSPYTVTTLPLVPTGGTIITGPTNCMTGSNANVPDIFFEVSAGGILRLRNYSSSAKAIRRVLANITFIAA